MTNHDHDRALDLIMRDGTEEVTSADLRWLESHLEICSACAEYASDFNNTGRLLRATAITASSSLVAATQNRVRARALEMQEQRSRTVLIALSFCLGAMSSMLSAWLWWRFDGWLAEHLGLSRAIVEPGVFVAWMLPAVVIAVFILASSRRTIDRTLTMELLGMQKEGGRQ
jgi:hypothetical protein